MIGRNTLKHISAGKSAVRIHSTQTVEVLENPHFDEKKKNIKFIIFFLNIFGDSAEARR